MFRKYYEGLYREAINHENYYHQLREVYSTLAECRTVDDLLERFHSRINPTWNSLVLNNLIQALRSHPQYLPFIHALLPLLMWRNLVHLVKTTNAKKYDDEERLNQAILILLQLFARYQHQSLHEKVHFNLCMSLKRDFLRWIMAKSIDCSPLKVDPQEPHSEKDKSTLDLLLHRLWQKKILTEEEIAIWVSSRKSGKPLTVIAQDEGSRMLLCKRRSTV